ncbi:DNA replication protein RecF [Candidatus Epulonipiscioides gigas]|nr:DNA replication protein RecF [Epulopiscium sp. SCG-C07WGA-EpuloA2]
MYITNISLTNFRNYEHINLTLSKGINIFFGDNAQGKTNILEAIYLCATARSHRTNFEKEIIRWGENNTIVNLFLTKQYFSSVIDFSVSKKNKSVLVNKLPINKLANLFGILNVVFFSPEDLGLIKKSPKERRRFIDIEICQLDSLYFSVLKNYYKILKQRNCYLKHNFGNTDNNILDVWDEKLCQYGEIIIAKRKNFIENLDYGANLIHLEISGKKENLKIIYEPDIDIKNLKNKFETNRAKDIRTKTTNNGPHKDDINFLINSQNAKTFASQGQQRTCILSVKLAQIDMLKNITGEAPVLLLDDVLSELDINRQHYLFKYTTNIQTLITCTGIDQSILDLKSHGKLFVVEKANIICKN